MINYTLFNYEMLIIAVLRKFPEDFIIALIA